MRPEAWRTAGKVALVAIFFGVSFVLLARVIGARSPWLGLLAMFYFLGLAKVAGPLVKLRMPKALRNVAPESTTNRVYRRLGVRAFGTLLRRTPLRYLNPTVYLVNERLDFARLKIQAQSAEASHFWAAVLFTPYIAYVWARGRVAEALLFVVIQVAFNVYPILHLRLVRARLGAVERAHARR